MQGEEGNSEAQENEWIKRGWRNNVKRGRDGGTNGRGPVSTPPDIPPTFQSGLRLYIE